MSVIHRMTLSCVMPVEGIYHIRSGNRGCLGNESVSTGIKKTVVKLVQSPEKKWILK